MTQNRITMEDVWSKMKNTLGLKKSAKGSGTGHRLGSNNSFVESPTTNNLEYQYEVLEAIVETTNETSIGITVEADKRNNAPIISEITIPNGPAAMAGLIVGDQILEINGLPTHSYKEFVSCIKECSNPLKFR